MAKESLIRKKAVHILESKGWIVWYPPKVRYRQTDIFGIIDLLALRRRDKKNIQLTTLSNVSARRRKIANFLRVSGVELSVEIWAWDEKKKGFRKEEVNMKTKTTRRA